MKFKPTWKEAVAVVALLAGAGATQISSAGSTGWAAVLAGGVLLAVERAAQAYEHRTNSTTSSAITEDTSGTTQSAA